MSGDRLRFEEAPRTRVSFPGTGARESVSHSARTNLPRRVNPGSEYQDVTVGYHLGSRLTGEPENGRARPPGQAP
ncbi:hypothetical protein ACGF5T_33940 [Streptomyces sp. NPDC047853]|uniref:hypothetical protein n=1 Tax=unclassified Streptomyces TaxID=2593676 RepID=UPI003456BE95